MARSVAVDVYRTTSGFPAAERFGLSSQLRRAAVSIGSNLSEGSGHPSNKVFARHIAIALGSAAEVDFQLELASDLGYVSDRDSVDLRRRVRKLRAALFHLERTVRARPADKY